MRFPITHTHAVLLEVKITQTKQNMQKSHHKAIMEWKKIETKRKAWRVAAIIRIRTINEFI